MTLDDFLEQMKQVRKMGPISQILGMIPGMKNLTKGQDLNIDERQMDRVEAIIRSMTPGERRKPETINGSRRKRIAAGSGVTVTEVNQLLSQFKAMQQMMKRFSKGRMPGLPGTGPGALG